MVSGRNLHQNKITWFVSLLAMVAIALHTGCKGDDEADNSDSSSKPNTNYKDNTTSVTPSATTDESPADSATQIPDKESDPRIVCKSFLAMLRSNNLKAQKLLTKTALAVTHGAELELKAIGNESAQYTISEPRFATNKQEMAYVDVSIVERIDGKPVESNITWLVKKKPEGWRISGMMLALDPAKPKDLLSFENPTDVAQINDMVGKNGPTVQQADANNANQK